MEVVDGTSSRFCACNNLEGVWHSVTACSSDPSKRIVFKVDNEGRGMLPDVREKFGNCGQDENLILSLYHGTEGSIDAPAELSSQRFKLIRLKPETLCKGGRIKYELTPNINLHIRFGATSVSNQKTVTGSCAMESTWHELTKLSDHVQATNWNVFVSGGRMPKTEQEILEFVTNNPELEGNARIFFNFSNMQIGADEKTLLPGKQAVPAAVLLPLHELARQQYCQNRVSKDAVFVVAVATTELWNAYVLHNSENASEEGFSYWLQAPENQEYMGEKMLALQTLYGFDESYRFDEALVLGQPLVMGNRVCFKCTKNTDKQSGIGRTDISQSMLEKQQTLEKIRQLQFLKPCENKTQKGYELDYDQIANLLETWFRGDCEDGTNAYKTDAKLIANVQPRNTAQVKQHIADFKNANKDFPPVVDNMHVLSLVAKLWPQMQVTFGAAGGANLMQRISEKDAQPQKIASGNIKDYTIDIMQKIGMGKLNGHAYLTSNGGNNNITWHIMKDSKVVGKFTVLMGKEVIAESTAPKLNATSKASQQMLDAKTKMQLSLKTASGAKAQDVARYNQIGAKLAELNHSNKIVMQQDCVNIISNIMTQIVGGRAVMVATDQGSATAFYAGDFNRDGDLMGMVTNKGLRQMQSVATPMHAKPNCFGIEMGKCRDATPMYAESKHFAIDMDEFRGIFIKEGTLGTCRSALGKEMFSACFSVNIKEDVRKHGLELAKAWASTAVNEDDVENTALEIKAALFKTCEEHRLPMPQVPKSRFEGVVKAGRLPVDILNPMTMKSSCNPKCIEGAFERRKLTAFREIIQKKI